MKTISLKTTLGALALSVLGLSPLAAQAGFCPLDMMLSGGAGPGAQSCNRQGSAPADAQADQRAYFNMLDRLEARQTRQLERIRQGVERGALTAGEAHRLMREQWAIERLQRRFLSDGFLTRDEWATLEGALNKAGQDIREQARDDEQG